MTFENAVTEQQIEDAWNTSADSRYLAFADMDGNTVIWDGEPTPVGQTIHVPAIGENSEFEYKFA